MDAEDKAHLGHDLRAGHAGEAEMPVVVADGGIDDDDVRVLEIVVVVAAEAIADGEVGETFDDGPEAVFVREVRDSDVGAEFGPETRRALAAAEKA